MIGVIISPLLEQQIFSSQSILVAGLVLGLIGLVKLRRILLISVLLSGMCFGVFRGVSYSEDRQDVASYFNQQVSLVGTVTEDLSRSKTGNFNLKLGDIAINSQKFSGEVWVSSEQSHDIKRSDELTLRGQLNEGFGSFIASMPRAEIIEIIPYSSQDIGLTVRDEFAAATNAINEPGRSLGLGLLLGQKNDLPEDLQNKILLLGLSHIVVASGYNLTILVAFARKIFAKISKYLSLIFSGGLIVGFMMITGLSPSMSRAGLVAGLSLIAWYYGRKIHPVSLLLVSASITLMIKPSYIWGDLGWYLSFLAFIGILILAPLLHHYFWGNDKKPSWLRELLVATFSAQLMTLPLLVYYFGSFSGYSMLANLLILPVVPFAMLAVFVSGIFGLIIPVLAGIVSVPANILLGYCLVVIDKLAGLPNVSSEITVGFPGMIASYSVLLVLLIALKLKIKHNFLKDKMIID